MEKHRKILYITLKRIADIMGLLLLVITLLFALRIIP
jgi:hypothetical protein